MEKRREGELGCIPVEQAPKEDREMSPERAESLSACAPKSPRGVSQDAPD